jgi:SanA protein
MKHFLRLCILGILFVAAVCVYLSLFVALVESPFIYASATDAPRAPVALVLGASVLPNGTLSPVLRERADMVALLYQEKKVSKILVSGDNSSLTYDEVYPIGKYLLSLGIPKQDIFLDYAGFDTYSSMYRARDVFGVTSLLVVTQHYHLPRALFIAHTLGLQASGVDASHGEWYLEYALREVPATAKAFLDIIFSRVPKYLGPQFPVSGDGSSTWVGSKLQMIYFVHGE